MTTHIISPKTFATLDPADVEKYLLATTWTKMEKSPSGVSIWSKSDTEDKNYRKWLPLNTDFADYEENIARAINSLSSLEKRSSLQILEDLETVAIGDVLRLSSYDQFDRKSSSLPIKQGISFIEQAKNMAITAALATEKTLAVYPSYRSPEVSSFTQELRLGQTERGSYRIKVISPIRLEQPNLPYIEEPPFARKAVLNLMKSLEILKTVSERMLRTGIFDFDAYEETVSEGVSANLCESLLLSDSNSSYRPIEISISWSNKIPCPDDDFRPISFEPDILPFIEKAAKEFREKNPIKTTILGRVDTLSRKSVSKSKEKRKITVKTFVENKPRTVKIELDENTYDLAVDAHKQYKDVLIKGTLNQIKNYYYLTDIESFQIKDN